MVVFIPHPSDSLVLARTQKTILSHLNCRERLWVPCFPLWVIPNTPDCSRPVQWYRNAVRKLTVCAPELNGTILAFPAVIVLNDGTSEQGTVRAAEWNGSPAEYTETTGTAKQQKAFPLECRIFRAADAQFTALPDLHHGCSWSVLESYWIKMS